MLPSKCFFFLNSDYCSADYCIIAVALKALSGYGGSQVVCIELRITRVDEVEQVSC